MPLRIANAYDDFASRLVAFAFGVKRLRQGVRLRHERAVGVVLGSVAECDQRGVRLDVGLARWREFKLYRIEPGAVSQPEERSQNTARRQLPRQPESAAIRGRLRKKARIR